MRRPRSGMPALALGGVLSLALAVPVVSALPAAEALPCDPPFDTLPGCEGGGGGGGGSDAEGWSTETIAGMSVQLYVPQSAPALSSGRALMVSLHGCAQTASTLRTGANWQQTADDYGMVVALPDAPNGGVIFGCWDYYDGNHSRTNPARHDDNLLGLVDELTDREALGLDPDQVYLSGLSSGGGETMVMGCLAPDVFAGIGINAGPTVGTTSGQISSVATSKAAGTNTCTGFAGSGADAFGTQLTSVVYGSNDATVAPGYNTLNGQIMAGIYGASTVSTQSLEGVPGSSTAGSATIYSDGDGPRVSVVQNTGLGHNWPAGEGPGGAYISTSSIDYPAYLTDFFFEHNRRVEAGTGPTDPEPTDPEPTDPEPTDPEPSDPEPTDPEPTDPEGPWCGSATNAEHESAGRAVSYGVDPYNPFYAVGSNDYLGQGDATVTTLVETSDDVYDVVTACP
ncbi:Translation initiation factor 2 [Serinicoccus hydrothermalis]|uniref:Translation initiation factor 2 n=1 Tax=Serinicoccus hydrothermalis TaxID=1758689 RepID=A0A1B1NCN5_9MICO|nr:PHB depolymerase family esterase [Serinicoccus hydrothermalis]ANS79197.1 Translation initiation factor 2 [Serinicoccus hydrothermalis]